MNYDKIVEEVIEGYKVSPIDMLGIGDASGEYTYLNTLKDSYVRTVRDVDNMIVGLHWREYTLNETIELIKKMGFAPVAEYYFQPAEQHKSNILKEILKKIAFSYPPFRSFQVVMGKKVSIPTYDFWLTDANS
ncbi:MAG: hypothetical protein RLZZ135_899 [Cyanobacteriota bacterium]|jgi:hypothetical protein